MEKINLTKKEKIDAKLSRFKVTGRMVLFDIFHAICKKGDDPIPLIEVFAKNPTAKTPREIGLKIKEGRNTYMKMKYTDFSGNISRYRIQETLRKLSTDDIFVGKEYDQNTKESEFTFNWFIFLTKFVETIPHIRQQLKTYSIIKQFTAVKGLDEFMLEGDRELEEETEKMKKAQPIDLDSPLAKQTDEENFVSLTKKMIEEPNTEQTKEEDRAEQERNNKLMDEYEAEAEAILLKAEQEQQEETQDPHLIVTDEPAPDPSPAEESASEPQKQHDTAKFEKAQEEALKEEMEEDEKQALQDNNSEEEKQD